MNIVEIVFCSQLSQNLFGGFVMVHVYLFCLRFSQLNPLTDWITITISKFLIRLRAFEVSSRFNNRDIRNIR